jgi:hypothetical protein
MGDAGYGSHDLLVGQHDHFKWDSCLPLLKVVGPEQTDARTRRREVRDPIAARQLADAAEAAAIANRDLLRHEEVRRLLAASA